MSWVCRRSLYLTPLFVALLCVLDKVSSLGDQYNSLSTPHTVHIGLIVMKNERKDLYINVAEVAKEYLRSNRNKLLRWTVIEIINRTIDNSPREAVQEACELIQRGVSTIIFPGPSHLVTTVADIANNYSIPVIAPTATDPFLIHPVFRPYLLQMPPTDTHQSEAIAQILHSYGWIYFSILTSYDGYGIKGMLRLQQIASDKKWKILNTQHFTVPKDLKQLNVTNELSVIKKSEARIIVLNCQGDAARRVLETAQTDQFEMTGDGYMWIMTDGIVGNQDALTVADGSDTDPSSWKGMLGTLPSYQNEDGNEYTKFVDLCLAKGFTYNLNKHPFAAMVYDSVLIFGHALNAYLEQVEDNSLVERKIICVHTSCHQYGDDDHAPKYIQRWEYGAKMFQHLTEVDIGGASRRYQFSSSGESLNLNYSIMNYRQDREFHMVGSYDSTVGELDQGSLTINKEEVVFMGGPDAEPPEYKPKTLKGRKLTLGINMEHPFISEHTVTCQIWTCKAIQFKVDLNRNVTQECNQTLTSFCKANLCDKHSKNCTIRHNDNVWLECQGNNCTQCNNSATCFRCDVYGKECIGCEGNKCYNGYCIDLVLKLAEELNFEYEFVLPRDGKWGGYNETTRLWDGLVYDLLTSYIDIATVHFSTNYAREKDIDFSAPFMTVGLAVVIKSEADQSNEFFFLHPFDPNVWYCVVLSAFLVTVIVCIFNKISPYGLYGRKMHALMTCPCNDCKTRRCLAKNGTRSLIRWQEYSCLVEEVDNYGEDRLELLDMSNSAWLIVACFLQQGPVRVSGGSGAPFSYSGRTILSVWWLAMMILIAMYTANLAASLTVTRMKEGIQKVEDLLDQSKYHWGTVSSTNPETLLRGSSKDEYQKLASRMVNVPNAREGFEKVNQGNYAFIYESALLEYTVQQTCEFVIVGETFSKFGFAFGFPPNSPYLELFNNVILLYSERNELDQAWEEIKDSTVKCEGDSQDSSKSTSNTQIDMKNLSGLFSVIILGITTSLFFLFAEYTFACFEDVYGNEFPEALVSERPKNIRQALRRRLKLTWKDILNHWFIFESFRKLKPPNEDELLHFTECEITEQELSLAGNAFQKWNNHKSCSHNGTSDQNPGPEPLELNPCTELMDMNSLTRTPGPDPETPGRGPDT